MTVSQLLPLIIALPLLGALINGTIGKKLPKAVVGSIATGVMLLSFVFALMTYFEVQHTDGIKVTLFEMLSTSSFHLNFAFFADNLSVWMTLIVTGIGTLIHLFSMGYMKHDEGYYKFFVYLNLFIFAMLILILGSNYFMLFFGWEGVGICSYLLIGFWYQDFKNTLAARKAFIMNRIGDLGLLVGLFLMLMQFGTLEYNEISNIVLGGKMDISQCMAVCITLCLFIGATGKSAQIPLFTWLPDAMAGPTPVSALIHAATMVTAGIFLTVRSNYLFDLDGAQLTQDIMLYIGLATSIVAAFIAMRQNDIKKVLAYSTVSQLGMLFVALGMGAYTAAMFHVTTHAFFKALLFLGSGSVIHAMSDEQDIRKMGGLRKKIPITHITFLIGTLAISGIPLLSGFYSKDEIIGHAFESHKFVYGALMFSSALTAIYMFRLYFVTFFGTFRGTHEQEHHIHEGPMSMNLPLIILAILSIFGGLLNLPGVFLHNGTHWLSHFYAHNVQGIKMGEHGNPNTTLMLMIAAGAMAVIIAIVTYIVYVKKNSVPVADENVKGWEKLSKNKLYFDEIYNFLFVKPTLWLSEKLNHYFEISFLHRGITGSAHLIGKTGDLVRKIQTGRTDTYILWMVFGLVGFVIYFLIYKF